MTDIEELAVAFLAGLLLGAFFFGGLWWTVQKGIHSETPALWFVGSVLLRTSLVLVGFYVVAQNHWSRLVICLLGFLLGRILVVNRLAGTSKEVPTSLEKDSTNAH